MREKTVQQKNKNMSEGNVYTYRYYGQVVQNVKFYPYPLIPIKVNNLFLFINFVSLALVNECMYENPCGSFVHPLATIIFAGKFSAIRSTLQDIGLARGYPNCFKLLQQPPGVATPLAIGQQPLWPQVRALSVRASPAGGRVHSGVKMEQSAGRASPLYRCCCGHQMTADSLQLSSFPIIFQSLRPHKADSPNNGRIFQDN